MNKSLAGKITLNMEKNKKVPPLILTKERTKDLCKYTYEKDFKTQNQTRRVFTFIPSF